jgi:hypothetical protein
MSKLNVERMRKRVSVPLPEKQPAAPEPEPEQFREIRDAAGRLIRVLPVKRSW